MKHGLSLSLCVQDIITDRVRVEDVAFITTNTCARDEHDWMRLVDSYRITYWRADPGRAARVVKILLDAGRILQPRVANAEYHHRIDAGIWQDIG